MTQTSQLQNKILILTTHVCPTIASKCTYRVVLDVPVTDEQRNVAVRRVERDSNDIPVVYNDTTKSTRCPLEAGRREVKETADLVFDLELVRPVPA